MMKHTQFVGNFLTNCLNLFGHFMGLALKGLNNFYTVFIEIVKVFQDWKFIVAVNEFHKFEAIFTFSGAILKFSFRIAISCVFSVCSIFY